MKVFQNLQKSLVLKNSVRINGTHHWISKKHTNRYLNDMTFRYNQRELKSQSKFDVFTTSFDGRLKYVELTKKSV